MELIAEEGLLVFLSTGLLVSLSPGLPVLWSLSTLSTFFTTEFHESFGLAVLLSCGHAVFNSLNLYFGLPASDIGLLTFFFTTEFHEDFGLVVLRSCGHAVFESFN